MGVVDLDGVEAGFEGAADRVGVRGLEVRDVLERHLARLGVVFVPGDRGGTVHVVGPAAEVFWGDGAGGEPGGDGRGFAAGVRELDHDLLVLRMSELDHAGDGRDLRVFPEPDVLGGDAAVRGHCGGLDTCQAWAALGDAADVSHMPIGIMSVLRAVLTQRTEHDAVLKGYTADLERVEELGDIRGGFALRDESSARGRVLERCEVGDARSSSVLVSWFLLDVRLDIVVRRHLVWFVVFVMGSAAANGGSDDPLNKLTGNVVYILIQRAYMPIAIKRKV